MEHVVFYPSADGSPAFRRVGSLDDAVRFVEHLRNVEDVTEFSVHQLTHVPLAFRAYYRAEVPADQTAPAEVVAVDNAAVDDAAVEDAAVEDVAVEDVRDDSTERQPVAQDPAPVDVPAPAEPAEVAPSPAEPVDPVEPAAAVAGEPAGDGRKSLSFFAR